MKFSYPTTLIVLVSLLGCANIVVDEPVDNAPPTAGSGGILSGADGGNGSGDPADTGGATGLGTGGLTAMGTGGRVFGGFGSGGRAMAGSGGTSAVGQDACASVMCNGTALPSPKGDVCFEFETSAFGGWQVSNAMGCTIIFDGAPAQAGQMVSAGTHTLKISGCTNNYVNWSCWY